MPPFKSVYNAVVAKKCYKVIAVKKKGCIFASALAT